MMIASLLLLAQAAPTAAASIDARTEPLIAKAGAAVRAHQPQAAIEAADAALAAYDADLAGEKRRRYCGPALTETILYMGMAARDKVDAVSLGPGYCTALYLKGFALVDLDRLDEARAVYDRLLVLAPMHAQYLTERGQLARRSRDWPAMLDFCGRAETAAALAPEAEVKRQKGAALRCQGYALVEQRKWDEAVARYRAALTLDPGDEKAAGELRYIDEQRGKG